MVFIARFGFFAPRFCPAIEDTDACIASEGKIATLLTLPAMLNAVEPAMPAMSFASRVKNMNEELTNVPCSEVGRPTFKSSSAISLSILKLRCLKSNRKLLRRRYITERIKLNACAIMVAHAAPAAPIPKTPTKIKSSITLVTVAIATKIKGWREFPIPLSTALTEL